MERVLDAGAPLLALGVAAGRLDVAASIDEEVPGARLAEEVRGVANGPALDDAGRIERAVWPPNVEIAVRLRIRLLGQRKDLAHVGAVVVARDLAAVDGADLAVGAIGAEAAVHRLEIGENAIVQRLVGRADHLDGDRHTHHDAGHAHGQSAWLSAAVSDWTKAPLLSVAPET